jgi:hypothetical protein
MKAVINRYRNLQMVERARLLKAGVGCVVMRRAALFVRRVSALLVTLHAVHRAASKTQAFRVAILVELHSSCQALDLSQ